MRKRLRKSFDFWLKVKCEKAQVEMQTGKLSSSVIDGFDLGILTARAAFEYFLYEFEEDNLTNLSRGVTELLTLREKLEQSPAGKEDIPLINRLLREYPNDIVRQCRKSRFPRKLVLRFKRTIGDLELAHPAKVARQMNLTVREVFELFAEAQRLKVGVDAGKDAQGRDIFIRRVSR